MKIFYGVQGTGNGHITRARIMAKELYADGHEIQFQFTGRPEDQYFDMEIFNDFQCREGLTFNTLNGKVNYIKTALQSSPLRLMKDIKSLDLSGYDLVISDFEPVTAWAAKKQNKPVLGIGHQYAFNHDIPRAGSDPIADLVMKNFAPADVGVGLHWHHFGQPILPPVIATPALPEQTVKNKIVVYLPFEDQNEVIKYLTPFKDFQFYLYSPKPVESEHVNIQCFPLSREGFQKDLYDCEGVLSNAGFELASEALHLGKKILAKPLHAQMEQISNAAALKQLGYGYTMNDMDSTVIEAWLQDREATRINYPNSARILADWIKGGMPAMDKTFTEKIWQGVEVLKIKL